MTTLPIGPSSDTIDTPHLTEDDLLALIDRLLPEWYLLPLKNPGPGYEWLQAMAAMMSRVSLAVARTDTALYTLSARGGTCSEADVEFYRETVDTGDFVIKAGTIVRTSRTNRSFMLIADVAFVDDALVVPARVRAVAPSPEYDVPGPLVSADGTPLAGEIDAVVIPIMDPVLAEPAIQVRQISDAAGGCAPVLDQHGLDRDLPRFQGEPDETYRGRVRGLPDTVSPDAIHRQLDSVFLPIGLTYDVIETWQSEYQTCFDAPNTTLLGPTGVVAPDCFAFDPPHAIPFRGRWLDEGDHMGGFVVVVPDVGAWSERGGAYDDPGTLGPGSTAATGNTSTTRSFATGAGSPIVTTTSVWAAELTVLVIGDVGNSLIVPAVGTVAGLGVYFSFTSGASLAIEVRDRERYDTDAATWVNDDGAVGVWIARPAVNVPVSSIENAINATSNLVQVTTPDPDLTKQIMPSVTGTFFMSMVGGIDSNVTARGWRAASAYDAPNVDGDSAAGSFVRVMFLDGNDQEKNAFYRHVYDLIQQIKGGGTSAAIELRGQ